MKCKKGTFRFFRFYDQVIQTYFSQLQPRISQNFQKVIVEGGAKKVEWLKTQPLVKNPQF